MGVGYSMYILFVSLFLLGILNVCNAERLRYNFYKKTCPQANQIVKQIITSKTRTNPALGAHLIRMQFHDCFVRGCDSSVLLDTVNNGSKAEKDAIPNRSLKGFDVIDDVKIAIEKFKRELWNVALGRRDGRISLSSETNGNIPSPFADFTSLLQTFNNKTLDVNDLVVLSGAHTIGVAHCGTFSRRLYNFTGKGDADPTLDPTYAGILRKRCPNPANLNKIVEMDPGSSGSFNKHYYDILRQNKGLFISHKQGIRIDCDSVTKIKRLVFRCICEVHEENGRH